MWKNRGLYFGSASEVCTNTPHAIKFCIALRGRFRLRLGGSAVWNSCDAVAVGPDCAHQIDGDGAELCIYYLMPETDEGRRLIPKGLSRLVSAIPRDSAEALVPLLREYSAQGCDREGVVEIRRALIEKLTSPERGGTKMDARIRSALEHLNRTPPHRATIAEISDLTSLSASRVAHLFREQVGVTISRYQLWLRACLAVERMRCSSSLTEIAHLVGFADSAHLSRTFRHMFGVTPSSLTRHIDFMTQNGEAQQMRSKE